MCRYFSWHGAEYNMVMMRILRIVTVLAVLWIAIWPSTAHAQGETRGLTVSPVRQEMTVKPGKASQGSFIIGNSTEKSMKVNLSVEQFSVADYTYDYEFRAPPSNDWTKLRQSQVELLPNKTQKIYFDIAVPDGSPPGGYYFSLFASTTIDGPGLPGTVRAASLLYVKVEGELVRTSVLENGSIPFWVTGAQVPYKFDVKNMGNVHFSAYFYGQISGLFGAMPESGTSHLLMPGATRTIEGSVPAPVLPGIYNITYGYKVDFADIVTTKSGYIIFIPPWSIIAFVFIVYVAWRLYKRRLHIQEKSKDK